ncbi:MAG: hypothetical protein AB7O39_11745 [Flavobacteriaceae bacterium]
MSDYTATHPAASRPVRPRASRSYSAGGWLVMIYGVVVGLLGLAMLAGGAYLIYLGGSIYYAIAGIGLIVAGVLLFQRRMAGLWVYTLTFFFTLAWGIAEVGFDGWRLIPWVAGPAILMVITLLLSPLLHSTRVRREEEAAR